jgi:hypothetical protein
MVNPFWLRQLAKLLLCPWNSPGRRIRRRRVRRTQLNMESLENRVVPSTIRYWINPLGGDWDTASNWLGGILPGPGDVAVINSLLPLTVTHSIAVADSIGSLLCTQTLDLSAGSLSVAANSNISTLDLAGGTLASSGTTTISGLFSWTSGTLTGSGQVNAAGGLLLSGIGPLTLDNTTLNNAATATWTSGNINTVGGSTFNNLIGGMFTAQSNATFHTTFNNSGTFVLASSANTTLDTLNNAGTLTLQSGTLKAATFNLSAGVINLNGHILKAADVTWTGGAIDLGGRLDVTQTILLAGSAPLMLDGSTINNYRTATWTAGDINTISGGTFNNLPGATFTAQSDAAFHGTFNNAGTFVLAGNAVTSIDTLNNYGTVALQGGTLNTSNYVQISGATFLGGLTLGASNPVQILGGSLVGSGTINADLVNGGQLTPGAPGVISVNGNYTQTVNGALGIAIGGANPGQFDRLQVTGTAALHGALDAYVINGYRPGPADIYGIVMYGTATSPFDVVTIANPNSAVQLGPLYGTTGIALAAVPAPLPTNIGTATNQTNDFARSALLVDQVFARLGFVFDRAADTQFGRLILSGAGGVTVENASTEAPAENGKASFTLDLRQSAGSAGMDESGADDDLVAALLAASGDFGPIRDSEFLSGSVIATSLLTGIHPKADILPPKGSRLASVATLLLGDVGEESLAKPNASKEDDLPLHELLINPVRGKTAFPTNETLTQDPRANKPDKLGASKPAKSPLSKVVVGSSLFLGATINITIPPTKRRRAGPRVRVTSL